MRLMRKDLLEELWRTRDMGTIFRLMPRSCSSRRVSVNRREPSGLRYSGPRECVCSTSMSMTCTLAKSATRCSNCNRHVFTWSNQFGKHLSPKKATAYNRPCIHLLICLAGKPCGFEM